MDFSSACPTMSGSFQYRFSTLILLVSLMDCLLTWIHAETDSKDGDTDQHLTLGMTMLAQGQYSDALLHFHAAIDADPKNYMSYYKRATVYLALNRPRPALTDIDAILEIKPDFVRARLMKCQTLLKMGRLDEAHIAAERLVQKSDMTADDLDEANVLYAQVDQMRRSVTDIEYQASYGQHEYVVSAIGAVMDIMPWYSRLRQLRAESHMALGNYAQVVADFRAEARMTPDSTDAHHKLAKLQYELGETHGSLEAVRECLRLDPDHAACFSLYKSVKKVDKLVEKMRDAAEEENDFHAVIDAGKKLLKTEQEVERVMAHAYERLCHSYNKIDQPVEAVTFCTKAIAVTETADILCDRGEAYLAQDEFDEAIADFKRALELYPDMSRAAQGLQTTQKRQKQASKKDYYKILGLKRNCRKRDIDKAYRKLAKKWHPDNFQDETERKAAEKKFMDIAAAKEVLSDPEKREQFDNGIDPLDPEAAQGHPQGGHPFAGGFPFQHFHHGGGGGGQRYEFKFHF